MKPLLAFTCSLLVLAASPPVHAETLLVERLAAEVRVPLPDRGQTMAQVEASFGAPAERLEPRGGQSRAWPVIQRWAYPAFTVYFEQGKVIDAVLNRVEAAEIGPKPPVR